MLRFTLIGLGLLVSVGLLPWAFNLVTGQWFSAGQKAKWESRFGGAVPSGRIRLMGAGGSLVLVGMILMVLAIFGAFDGSVTVPLGLVLVASGAILSLVARRMSTT